MKKKLTKLLPILVVLAAIIFYFVKGGLPGQNGIDIDPADIGSKIVEDLSEIIEEDNSKTWEEESENSEESEEEESAEESSEESKEESPEESEKEPSEESKEEPSEESEEESSEEQSLVVYGEAYTSKEEVAAYIYEFGELPPNYITKSEAKKLGWDSSKGNLWDVAYGKSIGGDKFGNYEKLLPSASGRQYYECDIDYEGGYRGAYRIIFSNDGLVYYTEDHYESFELLYGDPDA